MRLRRVAWAWLAAAALPGTLPAAQASCGAPPPPLPLTGASPARAPTARFNALVARDPYLVRHASDPDYTAPDWRRLVAALRADPAAPPELVARAEGRLAAALQDESGAEGMAAGRAALGRAEANGLADTLLHATILTALAEREVEAGKAAESLRDADAGLAQSVRLAGARSWEAGRAQLARSTALNGLGRYAEAEQAAAQAETLAQACVPPDSSLIAETAADHGSLYGMVGDIDGSLAAFERAIAWIVAHRAENGDLFTFVLRNYGLTLRNAGRWREAEAVLRRSVDLDARYRPDDYSERADGLGKFANLLAAEERWVEAEALWVDARALYAKGTNLSNPLAGSGELRRAADAAEAQGKLPLALARRQEAVALIASRVGADHPELARARLEQAATLVAADRLAEAKAVAEPAIAVLSAKAPATDFKRAGGEMIWARVVAANGDLPGADAIAAPVTARLEALMLDAATSDGDLVRYAPAFAPSFAAGAWLALAAGHPADAFRLVQLADLSDIAVVNAGVAAQAAATAPGARALIDALQARRRERQQADRDRLAAVAARDTPRIAAADAAVRAADGAIAATGAALDRAFPAYRALGRPAPAALAAVQARLGAADVLVAPLSLPDRTLTLALTRDGLRWGTAPVGRLALNALVARVRRSVEAGRADPAAAFDLAAARDLGAALLPPALAPALAGRRHLLYYAAGVLATLPPGLLVTGPTPPGGRVPWLIRAHSVTVVTRLGGPASGAATSNGDGAFLGVGAPALGGKPLRVASRGGAASVRDFGAGGAAALPPLPDAARELRAMAATYPAADRTLLLGADATRRGLDALPLRRYRVIAFATHGLMSDALPGLAEPALVLTPAAGDDGLLTASAVAGLRLDADWVILSACDTAGEAGVQTGSYSGLASAFVQAGARALLVSHWPVRDDAAARITVATLAAVRRGVDRATALRRAMLAFADDPRTAGAANPALWAPFVLVEP